MNWAKYFEALDSPLQVAFSKVPFFAKETAKLDQCLQKCKNLDGCEQ